MNVAGSLPRHGRSARRRALDDNLTQQNPARFRTALHLELEVAGLGADRAGKGERVPFERPIPSALVRDRARRGPFLAIAANRHAHTPDLIIRGPLIRHHVHLPNLLLRAQIKHQRDVAVVLNALAGCALPCPIVQQRLRLGVQMLGGGRLAGGILEGQAGPNRVGWRGTRLEHLARQIRGRRFPRIQPEPVSRAQVLAQVWPRSGQEHLRTRPRRLHGRGDATGPATHHDHIHFLQDRNHTGGLSYFVSHDELRHQRGDDWQKASHRKKWRELFPITPALSLGERGLLYVAADTARLDLSQRSQWFSLSTRERAG